MHHRFANAIEQRAPGFTAEVPAHKPVARASYLISHEPGSPGRRGVEDFIAAEFREHFNARIRSFMPTLLGLHDADGRLRAAAGVRAAARGTLFLEAYTNGPIEDVLRRQSGIDVARREIVEVGSLACTGARAALEIVTALVPALMAEGFSWVVFTGADTVRNVFRRLDLNPIALCIANKGVLGDAQHEWGTYYDHNPIVMAGRLADGLAAIGRPADLQ